MRRGASRLFAVIVLSVLGGPLALHFVVHDLHHAHVLDAEAFEAGAHGNHEHPVVGSSQPQVRHLNRSLLVPATFAQQSTMVVRQILSRERNFIAFGALRLDEDVGLQPLLSTFLI